MTSNSSAAEASTSTTSVIVARRRCRRPIGVNRRNSATVAAAATVAATAATVASTVATSTADAASSTRVVEALRFDSRLPTSSSIRAAADDNDDEKIGACSAIFFAHRHRRYRHCQLTSRSRGTAGVTWLGLCTALVCLIIVGGCCALAAPLDASRVSRAEFAQPKATAAADGLDEEAEEAKTLLNSQRHQFAIVSAKLA